MSSWQNTDIVKHTDVVIIGAGVIGCALAYEMAQRGLRVRVCDRRAPGAGASQASAGVLAPYIEAESRSTLEQLGVRSLELFDEFLSRVVADAQQDVPYVRDGTLEVATDDSGLAGLERSWRALQEEGVECELLTTAQVREVEPMIGPLVQAGLVVRPHGAVSVRELVTALVRAALVRRAVFVDACTVRRVRGGRDAEVETDQGVFRAPTVILAAGAWGGELQLERVPAVPVRPVRGQLLALAHVSPLPQRVVWGRDCYCVPWSDGRVLVGATVEDVGFDEHATLGGVRHLAAAASRLLPGLEQAVLENVRVGLRPCSPDRLPIVGRSRRLPTLVYATGHYRNGVLLAPLTAQVVADFVSSGREDPMLEVTCPARLGDL